MLRASTFQPRQKPNPPSSAKTGQADMFGTNLKQLKNRDLFFVIYHLQRYFRPHPEGDKP
jgi:hypothetical protein